MACTWLSAAPVWADPFASFPGARARGMAGAMTALPDTASVWYNPAATAREFSGLRLELYQTPALEADTDELQSSTVLFAGLAHTLDIWSVGLYYLTPYTMQYGVRFNDGTGKLQGRMNATHHALSLPIAVSMNSGALKLGMTLDWNTVLIDGTRLSGSTRVDDPKDPGQGIATELDKPGGLSASAGILARWGDATKAQRIWRLGAVYRSGANQSVKNTTPAPEEAAEDAAIAQAFDQLRHLSEQVLFARPDSFALGASLVQPLAGEQALTVALQADFTQWSSQQRYQKWAVGSEYVQPLTSQWDLTLAYRLGLYQSIASEGKTHMAWPDMRGLTLGFGITSQKRYQIDLSLAYQATEHADRNNDQSVFAGLSWYQVWR
jgi:hypothetical protein